jgi:hypothetical protein
MRKNIDLSKSVPAGEHECCKLFKREVRHVPAL